MCDTQKIYLADGEGSSNAGMWALVTSALQNRGMDPAIISALQNRGGYGNGFGDDLFGILLLFILFGWGRNGWGGNEGGNNGGGYGYGYGATAEREMLMSAIQRNGIDINTLSSTLGCSISQVEAGINSLATQICNLAGQQGLSAQQIINAIQLGNNGITSQLCNCCCDIKQLVTSQGYENQIATLNQTNALQGAINGVSTGVERGFANVGFASAQQTCELKQNADINTRAILAKLDAIEDSRKDREISTLTASLTAANSRAERAAELAPIYKALSDIQCKQPETVTLPSPCAVAVPSCVAAQFGLGFNGYNGFGFPWNGFTNAF